MKEKGIKARVIVFGSVVKGKQTPLSDLDILIVSDEINENEHAKLCVEIKEMLQDPFAPIEFHFASSKSFENWYKNFLMNGLRYNGGPGGIRTPALRLFRGEEGVIGAGAAPLLRRRRVSATPRAL